MNSNETSLPNKAKTFWNKLVGNEPKVKVNLNKVLPKFPLATKDVIEWYIIYRRFLNYIDPTEEERKRWTNRLERLDPNDTRTIFPYESFLNIKSFIKTVKAVIEHQVGSDDHEIDEDFIPNKILTVDELQDWKYITDRCGYSDLPNIEDLNRWKRRVLTLDSRRVGVQFPHGKFWDAEVFIAKVQKMVVFWENLRIQTNIINELVKQWQLAKLHNSDELISLSAELKELMGQQDRDSQLSVRNNRQLKTCQLCIRPQVTRQPVKATSPGVMGYLGAPFQRCVALGTRNEERRPSQQAPNTAGVATRVTYRRRLLPAVPFNANSRFRYQTLVEEPCGAGTERGIDNYGEGCSRV